jgi:SHS2 domain-containing protein
MSCYNLTGGNANARVGGNQMIGKYWEHFHHDSDIGVRGVGATKEEAFEQAAVALIGMVADPLSIGWQETVEVVCEAPDDELLLAHWLNALIYQMATRGMLFSRFDVQFEGGRLIANASGEASDVGRHKPAIEVKGATHTQLKVGRDETGTWLAQCVVDVR